MCSRLWIFRQRTMEKLLFCSLSYTSNTPNFSIPPSSPWPFWTNLKNPTLLFLPGLSFRRSQSTDVLFEESFRYNWHHFSWGKLEFSSWCSISLRLDSNPEMFYHLSLALHSWAVLLRFHSRTVFLSQTTSGKPRLYLQRMLFSLLFQTNTDPVPRSQAGFSNNSSVQHKIYFVLSVNLPTRGFLKSTGSQHSLSLPVCLESFH